MPDRSTAGSRFWPFSALGLLCLLAVAWLIQELTRVALDLRNPNGTYTLGVGWLHLSGLARVAVPLYWLAHIWLLAAAWRAIRGPRHLPEWLVGAGIALSVVYTHLLLSSMPLSQMIIRPWIR